MTVDKLIALYEQGLITEGELFPAVGQLVAPENADEILEKLTPALQDGIRAWALQTPVGEGIIVGSGLSSQQAGVIASRLDKAVPVIRAWFQSKSAMQHRQPATPGRPR